MSSDTERHSTPPHEAGALPLASARGRTSIATWVKAPRWASPYWLVLLGVAVFEVIALWVRIERVPAEQDFAAAAEVVRQHFREVDAITSAPAWADPLLRKHLGDRISVRVAGRTDLAAFERLWVLSIRGARSPEAPPRSPDFTARRGRVAIARYDFAPTPVVYDFVERISSAEVRYVDRGSERLCPLRRVSSPVGGGLGFGPAAPRERFVCDARRPWLWVGATVLEDLSLKPRRCIYQHPQGSAPVKVRFDDVPVGNSLVLYSGLDYHQERGERGAPITTRVSIAGREVASVVHRDGDGMRRDELLIPSALIRTRAPVEFAVTAPHAQHRAFCWAATMRDAQRREGS